MEEELSNGTELVNLTNISILIGNEEPIEVISEDVVENDEDYVINIDVAPPYIIPTEESEPMTEEEISNHIDEILEEVEFEEVEEVEQEYTECIIPENSRTILINQTNSRFSGATWYNKIIEKEVIIAGIGGIGSYVGFLLSRLNVQKIMLYDDDIVDEVNLSGQLYHKRSIGKYKTDALSEILVNFSNYYKVLAYDRKYTSGCLTSNIMICGFDNMDARKVFFDSWHNFVLSLPEEKRGECLFLDGRLAAEEYQILCLKGDDTYSIMKYKNEFLFSDSEAEPTICSYKQTTFMANQIASNMVNLFVNFVANQCDPLIERYFPFYTEYNAETMYLKTIS